MGRTTERTGDEGAGAAGALYVSAMVARRLDKLVQACRQLCSVEGEERLAAALLPTRRRSRLARSPHPRAALSHILEHARTQVTDTRHALARKSYRDRDPPQARFARPAAPPKSLSPDATRPSCRSRSADVDANGVRRSSESCLGGRPPPWKPAALEAAPGPVSRTSVALDEAVGVGVDALDDDEPGVMVAERERGERVGPASDAAAAGAARPGEGGGRVRPGPCKTSSVAPSERASDAETMTGA